MKEGRILLIFIAVTILIAAFISCPFLEKEKPKERMVTTIKIDTLTVRETFFYPRPYKIIERLIDTVFIDTSKAIQDYYTEKHYQVNYEDSIIKAFTDIKIAQNSVESLQLDYKMLSKTTQITMEVSKPGRIVFLLGGGFNYSLSQKKAGMELTTSLQIKKHQISLGYDFINQTPRLGWQYKITKN